MILDFIKNECVKVPLAGNDKDTVIRELVDLVHKHGDISDRDDALKVVMEREALMSTGIGGGIAIPHGKADSVTHLAGALGIAAEPIEFDSVDGEPVRLIILLVSSASDSGPHIRALSRISRLLADNGFRKRLTAAPSAADVISIIEAEEKQR